jgi:hypothetical protein
MFLQEPSSVAWAWQSFGEVVDRLFDIRPRPVACEICGRAPCTSPGFCALCRRADAQKAIGARS